MRVCCVPNGFDPLLRPIRISAALWFCGIQKENAKPLWNLSCQEHDSRVREKPLDLFAVHVHFLLCSTEITENREEEISHQTTAVYKVKSYWDMKRSIESVK